MEILQTYILYLCKMDPKKNTFKHAPSYNYNEVLQAL